MNISNELLEYLADRYLTFSESYRTMVPFVKYAEFYLEMDRK